MYLEGVWNVSGRCLEGNWSLTLVLKQLVVVFIGGLGPKVLMASSSFC